jgi:hypothetical protein
MNHISDEVSYIPVRSNVSNNEAKLISCFMAGALNIPYMSHGEYANDGLFARFTLEHN